MDHFVDHYRSLADYNARYNERLYDGAEILDGQVRRAERGAFFGSIHRTLNHILLADRIWLGRMRDCGVAGDALVGASVVRTGPGVALHDELYTDWGELRRERRATDEVIKTWTARFTPETPAVLMQYQSRGKSREHLAWVAISHMFNHQTHHRGQVHTLLTQEGVDVGTTDFLVFALDKNL